MTKQERKQLSDRIDAYEGVLTFLTQEADRFMQERSYEHRNALWKALKLVDPVCVDLMRGYDEEVLTSR